MATGVVGRYMAAFKVRVILYIRAIAIKYGTNATQNVT
jgi:hypothetical protein